MSGPYVIKDPALLQSLVKTDAVIPDVDQAFGVQCVGLVKYYAVDDKGNAIPATGSWDEGTSVKDAVAAGKIDRGTAIATFHDGKYPQKPTDKHACFFIDEQDDKSGFRVLEQNVKPFPKKIQVRVLKYQGKPDDGDIEMNNGDCYSIIL